MYEENFTFLSMSTLTQYLHRYFLYFFFYSTLEFNPSEVKIKKEQQKLGTTKKKSFQVQTETIYIYIY